MLFIFEDDLILEPVIQMGLSLLKPISRTYVLPSNTLPQIGSINHPPYKCVRTGAMR